MQIIIAARLRIDGGYLEMAEMGSASAYGDDLEDLFSLPPKTEVQRGNSTSRHAH